MCYQPPGTGICVTFSHLGWGDASPIKVPLFPPLRFQEYHCIPCFTYACFANWGWSIRDFCLLHALNTKSYSYCSTCLFSLSACVVCFRFTVCDCFPLVYCTRTALLVCVLTAEPCVWGWLVEGLCAQSCLVQFFSDQHIRISCCMFWDLKTLC
jgi:hypothetical protein